MKIPGFVWVLVALVVGFGFLFILISNKNNQVYQNVKIPINVEIFEDYNCPHCAEFEPVVEDVRQTYGDKVNIINKQLPILTTGRAEDTSAEYAYAAEAARLQGKFLDYHQDLFRWVSYQRDPSNTLFTYTDEQKTLFTQPVDVIKLATFLKLDVAKFTTDMNSDQIKQIVRDEKTDATNRLSGAPSTPAIFIFGQRYQPSTYEDFKTQIGNLIKQAEQSSPTSSPI